MVVAEFMQKNVEELKGLHLILGEPAPQALPRALIRHAQASEEVPMLLVVPVFRIEPEVSRPGANRHDARSVPAIGGRVILGQQNRV